MSTIKQQISATSAQIAEQWKKLWTILQNRRIDVVFYFGSTVKWLVGSKKRSVWSAFNIDMRTAFVDKTEKGYEIYLPVLIHKEKHGNWLADVKLHDILTADQYIAWLKKINEFPYV